MKENIKPINKDDYFLDENGNPINPRIDEVGITNIPKSKSKKQWYKTTGVRDYITGKSDETIFGRGAKSLDRAARDYQYLSEDFSRHQYSPKFMARKYDKFGGIDLDLIDLTIKNAEKEYNSAKTKFESGEISEKEFNKITKKYQRTSNNLNENYKSLYEVWHGKNDIPLVRTQSSVSAAPFILGTVGLPLAIIGGVKVAPYLWTVLQNPLVQALGTYEGIKNLTSENGVQKTINHFKNDEYGKGALSLTGDVLDALPIGADTFSGIRGISAFKNGQRGWNLFNTAFGNTDTMKAIKYVNDMKNKAQLYGFTPNISLSIPKNQLNSGLPLNWIDGIFNRTRYNEAKALTNYANINGININVADPKWRYKRIGSIPDQLEDARLRIGTLKGTTLLPSSQNDIQLNTFFGEQSLSDYERRLNQLYDDFDTSKSHWVDSDIPGVRKNLTDWDNPPVIKGTLYDKAYIGNIGPLEWKERGYDLLDTHRPLIAIEREELMADQLRRQMDEEQRLKYIERAATQEYEQKMNWSKFISDISKDFKSPYLKEMITANPRYYTPMKDLMKLRGLSEEDAWRQLITDRNTLYRSFGISGNSMDEVSDLAKIEQYARQLTKGSVNASNEAMVGYQRAVHHPNVGGIFTGQTYIGYGGPSFTLRRILNRAQDINSGDNMIDYNEVFPYHKRYIVKLQPKLDFGGPIETWFDKNPVLPRSSKHTPTDAFTFNTNNYTSRYDKILLPEEFNGYFNGSIPERIEIGPGHSRARLAPEITIEGPEGSLMPFEIVDLRSQLWKRKPWVGQETLSLNYIGDFYDRGFALNPFSDPSVSYGYKQGGKLNK